VKLAAAIDERQMLVGMLRLDGVGHDFSAPTALAAALEAELAAYRAVLTKLGLAPAPWASTAASSGRTR
jgi:hypothetical protein